MNSSAASSRPASRPSRATRSGGGEPRRIPLTDRVNVEPPILNGMTASEAKLVGSAAIVAWGVVGAVVSIAFGMWQLMIFFGVFMPACTVWFCSSRLAAIKRDRPDGFYRQALHRWAVQRALAKPRFLNYAGFWTLGRGLAPKATTDEKARRGRKH